jgi:phosphopantetheinyl transferase
MDLFYINCENFDGNDLKEKQHNAGRYIVSYVAEKIYKLKNSEIEIVNKKPKFKLENIHFSISHSNCYAVVAFDKNPVGVDIEKITERDFLAIAKRMKFELKENTLEDFYCCWTLFEAEYKLQDKAKSTLTIDFKDEYKISVASSTATDIEKNLNISEITF